MGSIMNGGCKHPEINRGRRVGHQNLLVTDTDGALISFGPMTKVYSDKNAAAVVLLRNESFAMALLA